MPFHEEYERIFGEKLKQHGFSLMKNSDIFARVVKGEILQFIYTRHLKTPDKGLCTFTIETSVRSVYTEKLSKREIKSSRYSIYNFFSDEEKLDIPWQQTYYTYNEDGDSSPVLQKALDAVMRLIIPIYDNIISLNDYIEYSLATEQTDLSVAKHNSNETLVWVKAYDTLDIDRLAAAAAGDNQIFHYRANPCDIAVKIKKEYILKNYIEPLQAIINDPILLAEAQKKLEKVRQTSFDFLLKNNITTAV